MKKRLNATISSSLVSAIVLGGVSNTAIIANASEEGSEKLSTISQTLSNGSESLLPKRFINSSIGNDTLSNSYFNEENKEFTIEGSGTYIGKDSGATDNYTFVNYKVDGDATIIAKLSDFDMTSSKYGQTGIFMRADNTTNNADYFGVYVEPSKNQYRYAYRSGSTSGAATIAGLTAEDKDKYIKIERVGNVFRFYISDSMDFTGENVITNSQTINTATTQSWYVGFVASNGGSSTGNTIATYSDVNIIYNNKTYYDSNSETQIKESVEGVKAVSDSNSVTLSWDALSSANKYIIKRSSSIDGNYEVIDEVENTTNLDKVTYIDTKVSGQYEYFYKISAVDEYNEEFDDSKIVRGRYSNYVYGSDAANFTIINEILSTVHNKKMTLNGFTDKSGTVKVMLNGEVVNQTTNVLANQEFNYTINLKEGRNTIEIQQIDNNNNISTKKYSVLYLAQEAFDIIVDKSYEGESGTDENGIKIYKTVQEAISSISSKNTERKVIYIKNGTYKEKISINSPYISLIGEDVNKTILTYDDASNTINEVTGTSLGTSKSASVTVKSNAFGFTAENITIENSYVEEGKENEQAVAFNNEADQSSLINCKFIGNQDTLLANSASSKPARQYYTKCYIEGDVDFIFGRAQAVFDDCDIVSLNKNSQTNNGYITAADTYEKDSYGYLIINSRLLGADGISNNSVSLGRPWRPSSSTQTITPSVAYVNCYMGSHIKANGWDDMGDNSLAKDSRFYEFGNYGEGSILTETRNYLSINHEYTLENVFSKSSASINGSNAYSSDWNPVDSSNSSNNVNINYLYKTFDLDNKEDDEVIEDETKDKMIWVKNDDNSWSLMLNGEMLKNWQLVNNKWYYLDKDGIMKTGWIKLNSKWYYLNNDGSMATGWIKLNNKWYYLNSDGSMATGWIKLNNKWYYLNNDGSMATGWIKLNSKWYYLNSDGSMATGWIKLNNKWYHLYSDGSMTTGWIRISDKWYYLYSDGSMAANTIINGYKIDSDGVWIK